MLTQVDKTKYLGSTLTCVQRYSEEGDNILSRFIIGVETRVAYATPESKPLPME